MVRFLRKILLAVYVSSLVLGGVFPLSVSAAIPNVINYQSRLRSSSLAPITALTSIQFTLYTDPVLGTSGGGLSSSGPVLWKEVHDGITCSQIQPDADGYFSVQLGACIPFPSYITWNQSLYLGVKIASDSEASPRVLLGAHQYALNSQALNGFTASTTAHANTILALDNNQNFNIATGTFMGAGLTITASSSLQDVTFAIATGTALNLANYLSIGAIRLDQTGTTNLTSGAYLVGVFDEFTNSNATTVQAALRDFDLALTAVSSTSNPTSTLQRAYDGGGIGLGNTINLATSTPIQIQTTVPGLFSSQNGIIVTKSDSPNQGIVFGTTNYGSNFSHFGMSDDISNITGASGVFAFYNHNQNNFGFSLLAQSGAVKSVFTLTNPDLGNKAAFEIENQSTINSTGILRLRNIPDSANIELHVGMSSPEGVITSDVGNIFFRRDGIASGTQLYIKTQEGNSQGWIGVATVDMLNASVSSTTSTLQSAYDGGGIALGNTINTQIGQGVQITGATNSVNTLSWNPSMSITNQFATNSGMAWGSVDVLGYSSPIQLFSSNVTDIAAATSVIQYFNTDPNFPFYQLGLIDGPNGLNTLGLLEFSPTLTALNAGNDAMMLLQSGQELNIESINKEVLFKANASKRQEYAFSFAYNSTTGNGISVQNGASSVNLSSGAYDPEGVLIAPSGSIFLQANSISSGTQLLVKTTPNTTSTGWIGVATVDMLGGTAEADTLQSVTDRGNSTTNTIQFAGGTSTALFTLTKSLIDGGGLLEPQILIKDTTSTGGIVIGRYNTGIDENYSSIAFTEDTALNPSNTTSVSLEYSHLNNNLLMRVYGNGIFKNGISLGDIVNFESALDQGVGPTSAFNFSNYGTLKGIMSFSNPQASMDFFMATGSPVGQIAANSGSLYFQTDAASTSTAHLFLKTADNSSAGWKQVALLEDVTSTAGTLQTVTNLGNTTTNTIQFAGATSTGNVLVNGRVGIGNLLPVGQLEVSTAATTFPNGWGADAHLSAPNSPAMWLDATATNNGIILASQTGNLYVDAISNGASSGYLFQLLSSGLASVNPNNSFTGGGLIVNAGTSNTGAALALTVQNSNPWIQSFTRNDIANSAWNTWIDTNRRFQFNSITAGYVFGIDHDSGNIRIGNSLTAASSKLHIDSSAIGSTPILTLQNLGGDIQQFVVTSTPEGLVTGSLGDMAMDVNSGRLYVKQSGTSTNTGWASVATGTTPTNSYVLGGNSFATTSYLGTNDAFDLRLGTSGTAQAVITAAGANLGQFTLSGGGSGARRLRLSSASSNNNYILFDGNTADTTIGSSGNSFFVYDDASGTFYQNTTFTAGSLTQQTLLSTGESVFLDLTGSFGTARLGTNSVGRFFVYDTDYRFVVEANGNVGIGETAAATKLHVTATTTQTTPIITVQNADGNFQIFNVSTTPEGLITGSRGDLSIDSMNGRMYIKETGTSTNTGWVSFATGTISGSGSDTFQTVTNRGNSTTNTIQFAGGTSTGQFVVQSTSTMRDIVPAGPYTGNVSGFNLGSTTFRWKNVWGETVNVGSSTWSLSQNNLNNFAIFNGPNKTGNEVMTIDTATENVGFGTMAQGTAPQARLHVLGGNILMGGNLGEEIFRLDPVANTVSLGDSTAWNSNTYLQVDDNNRRIIMPNGNIGIGTSSPTAQLDVVGRMSQESLGNVVVPSSAKKIVTQGRYAYVISPEANALTVVDITRPRSMLEVGNVNVSKRPTDIVVQGQYAYVTAFDTSVLYAYDISDPTSPNQVGVMGVVGGSPAGIAVQGKYGFVISQGGDRLESVDLSDPSSMNSITSIGICSQPGQILIAGRYAYVSCADDTISIVDIQDPTALNVVNTLAVGRNPQGIEVRGRYLYVTSYDNRELEIYDIKKPFDPSLVSSTGVCRGPNGVKVQSNIAYVSCELDNTLTAMDITDPSRPRIIGTDNTEKAPQYFAITGRYIFIPLRDAGLMQSFDLGGAFLQQLEVGGLETDTLNALNGAQIGSNLSVEGSMTVGRSARINGTLTVSGGMPGVSTPFTIDQQGHVGIGTVSPDQLLSVNGDASKIGGGTWSTFSDQRLKSDISVYSDGLDLITKINPVHFRYNGLGGIATSSKSYVGVLAQDIQQVAPYMVATTSVMLHKTDSTPTEVLTFDPNAITYALINSVKQLNAKLDQGSNNKQVTITTTTQGEIHFGGIISFDADTVGQAKILSGSKEVRVTFSQAYSAQPIVTVSPMDFVDAMYRVTDVTNKGFTIQLNANQSGDRLFSWHAFAGSSAQIFVSDGTTSTVQLIEQSAQPDEQASSTPQITPPIESATTSTTSTEPTL